MFLLLKLLMLLSSYKDVCDVASPVPRVANVLIRSIPRPPSERKRGCWFVMPKLSKGIHTLGAISTDVGGVTDCIVICFTVPLAAV